ncbi:MAG: NAD-dependent epimerase/dehydratase family protein, partial [Myxococcota bacterium]
SYPKTAPIPFTVESLWSGYPEETNAPYGLAKKMLLVMGHAYHQQYGLQATHLIPVNLYGPGDSFHLEHGHVIPALIRKCIEAVENGTDHIHLWGDGSPTREFLYVEDAAEAIVLATAHYHDTTPLNLGSGVEVRIQTLAERIAAEVGFAGELRWDGSRPNGQPRRLVDSSRARKVLGWSPQVPFAEGLRRTVDWFRTHRGER